MHVSRNDRPGMPQSPRMRIPCRETSPPCWRWRSPACISGALEERDFVERIHRAGFAEASVEVTNVYDGSAGNNMCGAPPMPDGLQLVSGFVRAVKPSGCCSGRGCC